MTRQSGSLRALSPLFLFVCATGLVVSSQVEAAVIRTALANRSIVCKGGNESGGQDYVFRTTSNKVMRIDHRFPDHAVEFKPGNGVKGKLAPNWSFETLSDNKRGFLTLYERVSLRSPHQTRHIYRTYELHNQSGEISMVLYDGVNGARDWRMKTTRRCSKPGAGNRFVKNVVKRYWSTTFAPGK